MIAQLKIDLGNSTQANKQLQVKYDDNPSVSLISSRLIVSFDKLEFCPGSEYSGATIDGFLSGVTSRADNEQKCQARDQLIFYPDRSTLG